MIQSQDLFDSKKGHNMKLAEISYRILYHVKGYIRLEIPHFKKLPWLYLFKSYKKAPQFSVPPGINHFHINPVPGSIVILYDSDAIDILEYLGKMASDPEIRKIIEG